MFQNAEDYDEVYDCVMVTKAKNKEELLCNPIYHFTNDDVWRYIKEYDVDINPLYAKGYKRVGCVMCPLGGKKAMLKEAEDFPKYKAAYIRAFDKMLEVRRERGLKTTWTTGEEVYRWWTRTEPKKDDGQMGLEL